VTKRREEPQRGPARPRGRFVSRSIAVNEQLASVSLRADYLFRACIPHLDAEGRITGNPALLRSIVAPLRAEISDGVTPDLLRELCAATDHTGAPLIFWYEIAGTKVVEFPGFERQQQGLRKDREAPSKLPSRNGKEKLLHMEGPTPDQLYSNAGVDRAEVEVVVEGEVEVEGKELPHPHHAGAREGVPGSAEHDPAFVESTRQLVRERLDHAQFAEVEAFVGRRSPETALGWWKEMLTLMTSRPAEPRHIAQVCADDRTLAKPIASAGVFRKFVMRAIQEERERDRAGAQHPAPRRNGQQCPPQTYDYSNTTDSEEDLQWPI
jgi:hypothetical protein